MEPWVFFDVGNLVWRAYHTTGKKGLKFGSIPTGVTYGFLREVKLQLDRHQTGNAVFCFDSKAKAVRKEEYAGYKERRHARVYTPEEEAEYKMVQKQVRLLKKDYLPSLGFKNILEYEGFEADDAIALAVMALREMSYDIGEDIDGHVISSDKDLLQLLTSGTITCWTAGVDGVATTKESFELEWGLNPAMWATIKAIAGCKSDEVPGIDGVGEKTAASYLRKAHQDGEELTKKELLCLEFMKTDQFRTNLNLVFLPHSKLKAQHPHGAELHHQPQVTQRAWKKLFERLGIRSIV